MTDLMTLAEVAEYTRTPESTLRYWRLNGYGPPSFKIGRRVRYRRVDVDNWLEDQRKAS